MRCSMARVWSASPALMPPLVSTTSAREAASRRRSCKASGWSATTPRSSTLTPMRCSRPMRLKRLLS